MFKMGWWLLIKTVLKRSLQDVSLVSRTVRSAQWYQEYSFKLHFVSFFTYLSSSFSLSSSLSVALCLLRLCPSLSPFLLLSLLPTFFIRVLMTLNTHFIIIWVICSFSPRVFFLFLLETADKVVGDNNQINLSKNLLLSFGCWH